MPEYIYRQFCRMPNLLALALALSSDNLAATLFSLITSRAIEIARRRDIVLSIDKFYEDRSVWVTESDSVRSRDQIKPCGYQA